MWMVELNHCWVQFNHCWVKILKFISSTYLHTTGLTTDHRTTHPYDYLYSPFLLTGHKTIPPCITWHSLSTFTFYTPLYSSSLPPLYCPFLLTGHKTIPPSVWLFPLWHSQSTFLFFPPYLFAYQRTIKYCCKGAAQLPLSIVLPTLHTQHCRILWWYSSIAAGLPTGHKTTVWLAPFWHSLSTFPFYSPYLLSYHKILP